MKRKVFVSDRALTDSFLEELRELGVRVAIKHEDETFGFRGSSFAVLPPKATCCVVHRQSSIEDDLLKATIVIISVCGTLDAAYFDLVPLPSPSVIGAEVFDMAFKSIHSGGPKRWTVGQENDWERQLSSLKECGLGLNSRVLIPLAGDVPFAAHVSSTVERFFFFFLFIILWLIVPSVTAVEWSSVALDKLRSLFPEGKVPSNVRLEQEEWFSWAAKNASLRFTHVFDKDAFGFCNVDVRERYVASISSLVAIGGVVYLEVKERLKDVEEGPPFHISEQVITAHWKGKKKKKKKKNKNKVSTE
jgi:hypothetical protein